MTVPLIEFAFSGLPPELVPTLTTSERSSDEFASLFQPIVARILGFAAPPFPWGVTPGAESWKSVRIGWQQNGQPAWGINDDVCILMASIVDDPFSKVRDGQIVPNDDRSYISAMSLTAVWRLHFTIYGPNSLTNARRIISSMFLDWVHDILAALNIYAIVEWPTPQYVPENKIGGEWWKRVDFDIRFNELVNESVVLPLAAGVTVTVDTDTGDTRTFTVEKN